MDRRSVYFQALQSLITRLNTNSFLIKGWSITLGSAFLALAITTKSPSSVIFGVGPIGIFWLLDSYYLMMERRYRDIFCKGLETNEKDDVLFSFDHQSKAEEHSLIQSAASWPVLAFYLGVSLALILVYLLIDVQLQEIKKQ